MKSFFISSSRNRKGFTLIEILVVVLVSAMLTGMVILYSGTSRDTVSLSVETTRIAQTLLRAKSLAVSTYTLGSASQHGCAYGIAFDTAKNTFSMVSYVLPVGTPCASALTAAGSGIDAGNIVSYSSSTWQVPIGAGVRIAAAGASLVLFYPPEPAALLSDNANACVPGQALCMYTFPAMPAPVTLTLTTIDGNASNWIVIGTQGQVDIQ